MNDDIKGYHRHMVEMSNHSLGSLERKQLREYMINYFSNIEDYLDNKYTDAEFAYKESIDNNLSHADELSELIQHIADSKDND